MYEPFEFEGELTPSSCKLQAAMMGAEADRRRLVRAAVTSHELAEEMVEQARALLSSERVDEVEVALYFARSIGLRPLVHELGIRVMSGAELWRAQPTLIDGFSTLASAGVDFVFNWALPGDSMVEDLIVYGLATPGLRRVAWVALPVEMLQEHMHAMPNLLLEEPSIANEVATKYALMCREGCPELCTLLVEVPKETRALFAQALEKNLRRIGKIKMWVACRRVLAALPD